jgi:hypothetical protein
MLVINSGRAKRSRIFSGAQEFFGAGNFDRTQPKRV